MSKNCGREWSLRGCKMNDVLTAIQAITKAVASRDLSLNAASPRWAGHFLYIGVEQKDGQTLNKFVHTTTKRPIWGRVKA